MEALSDKQITKQYIHNPRFGGVKNKSDMTKLSSKCYVFNLDTKRGPGTHWTMVSNINPLYVYYFDSFGEPPPEHVLRMMKSTGKQLLRNNRQVQDIKADSCGYWCIFMINMLLQGHSPADINNWFTTDSAHNERILNDFYIKNPLK